MPEAPLSGTPCGLLVDWGGVLTTDVFAAFDEFCAREGLAGGTVREAFRSTPAARAALVGMETGVLTEADFELVIGPLLGVPTEGLVDRMMAGTRVDPEMVSVVRRAHDHGIATGLISNSWGLHRYDMDELRAIFDGLVISGQVGIRKPAPEIYLMGAASIHLPPSECVFVDDMGGNLKPARDLGMRTVLHRDAKTTAAELSSLFEVDLSVD